MTLYFSEDFISALRGGPSIGDEINENEEIGVTQQVDDPFANGNKCENKLLAKIKCWSLLCPNATQIAKILSHENKVHKRSF